MIMENENSQEAPVTTRSIGIRFGLYSALCRILLFAIAVVLSLNAFNGPISWLGLIIGIGIMVWAHIQFKKEGSGYMQYSQGVGIGFWMGLIGTVVVVPIMYVYLTFVDSSPFDLFLRAQEDEMIAKGVPDQAIEMGITWTKKLFWPSAIFGGVIGSVIIALIISIFTKKSSPEMPV